MSYKLFLHATPLKLSVRTQKFNNYARMPVQSRHRVDDLTISRLPIGQIPSIERFHWM